jgi:hypothetical protein
MHVIGVNTTLFQTPINTPKSFTNFHTILKAVCKETHSDQRLSESKLELTRNTLRPEAERENQGAAHTQ